MWPAALFRSYMQDQYNSNDISCVQIASLQKKNPLSDIALHLWLSPRMLRMYFHTANTHILNRSRWPNCIIISLTPDCFNCRLHYMRYCFSTVSSTAMHTVSLRKNEMYKMPRNRSNMRKGCVIS